MQDVEGQGGTVPATGDHVCGNRSHRKTVSFMLTHRCMLVVHRPKLDENFHIMFDTPMSMDPVVAIIGGGLAGLCCSLQLARRVRHAGSPICTLQHHQQLVWPVKKTLHPLSCRHCFPSASKGGAQRSV